MKRTLISKVFTLMCAMLCIGLISCGEKKKEENTAAEAAPAKPKILVLYYSQNGATQTLAEELQRALDADMEAIECETPYDGDFQQTISRCQDEMADGVYPTIKSLKANIGEYDVIFLGYPVWFGTYARPIGSLLRSQSFDGCKVVTFCTFGSGGLETSSDDLKKSMEGAKVTEGIGVRNARVAQDAKDAVNRYLVEAGYIKGEVEKLTPFAEHYKCTKDEEAVYHQACDDYIFPFGAPVDVAVRETSTSTDYEFAAIAADGRSLVYVSQPKAEGEKAYFTKVVRKAI